MSENQDQQGGGQEQTTSEKFEERLIAAANINKKIAALMADGVDPTDDRVLEELKAHHRWVIEYLRRDKKTYTLLGNRYISDDRFEGVYREYAEGLAAYMGTGIIAYAEKFLTDDLPEDEIDPSQHQNN